MRVTNTKTAGFSLLEMSVVLVIISTVIGVGVAYIGMSIEKKQRDTTILRMNAIQKALLDYRRAYEIIPCPSDITLAETNTNFGRGNIIAPCDGVAPAPNFIYDLGVDTFGGGVPVRTLKLPDEYAFDGWGRRFTYFVDGNVTGYRQSGFNFQAFTIDSGVGWISVSDGNGTTLTSIALYALISHGPNGHGAYTRYGTSRINAGSSNAYELQNCGCNAGAVYTSYGGSLVQGPYKTNPATGDTFDDIVVYGTRASLRHVTE